MLSRRIYCVGEKERKMAQFKIRTSQGEILYPDEMDKEEKSYYMINVKTRKYDFFAIAMESVNIVYVK